MKDKTEKNKSAETSSSADLKMASRIISGLNLIRMNIGMYPPGHARITESIDQTCALIQKYLHGHHEMVITVAGESLLINNAILDKKNNSFREFARILNAFRIVSFSLHRTLKKEDLFQINRILSSKPSDVWAMGKLEKVLDKSGITGIKLKTIDADYFNLTEETGITSMAKTRDEDFWLEFLSRLTANGSGVSPETDSRPTVQELNDSPQHWQKTVASYENMIREYFYEIRTGKRINADNYQALTKIGSLIDDLHPDLKEQLLEVVERQLSIQPETALNQENLKCFPQEMLIDMISMANDRKSEVSPALIMLLQKISAVDDDKKTGHQDDGRKISEADMKSLLKREAHETYVPDDYNQILKKATRESLAADDIDEALFPLADYLTTLEEEQIEFRLSQLVLILMDGETDDENYLAYSSRLSQAMPYLLKTGQFAFLTGVIETLRRHGREKTSVKIRQRAISALSIIADYKAIAQYVTPYILRGADSATVARFLITSGIQNIPWLFDLYLHPSTPYSIDLLEIIKGFGGDALDEALKRLANQTPEKTIRLLALIKETGDIRAMPLMAEIYEQNDWNIKKEVLEIIFFFEYPTAINLLKKSLYSSNREEILFAVGLICRHSVTELFDDMMSFLKTFYIREQDAILNKWIIQELGATGNPEFLPCLEKILAIRFTFSPQQISRMKELIYESLGNFPPETVLSLLERGAKSRNKTIKASCLKIMAHKGY